MQYHGHDLSEGALANVGNIELKYQGVHNEMKHTSHLMLRCHTHGMFTFHWIFDVTGSEYNESKGRVSILSSLVHDILHDNTHCTSECYFVSCVIQTRYYGKVFTHSLYKVMYATMHITWHVMHRGNRALDLWEYETSASVWLLKTQSSFLVSAPM